jgi:hypothetical protein
MTPAIGLMLGKAMFGVSDSDFTKSASFIDTLHEDKLGSFHKQAAALAADCYERAGRCDRFGYHLYVKMASHVGPWPTAFVDLVIPVYRALGMHPAPELSKQANIIDGAGKAVGGLVSKYPTLLGIAALLGAGGGALSWQAGQDDVEDDEDAARMQAQMKYLNSVTDEIDADLKRRIPHA